MGKIFILVFLGAILIVSSQSPQEESVGHTDYDLGVGGDETFVDEPTTARPARRRVHVPGSRLKAKAQTETLSDPPAEEVAAPTAATTTTTSERPAKRSRTSNTDGSTSRTTTKSPEATEQPVGSTYRRPKFPPRRLPARKTTTVAPVEDTADPLYEDILPAEEPVGQDGHPADTPIGDELAPQ